MAYAILKLGGDKSSENGQSVMSAIFLKFVGLVSAHILRHFCRIE